MGNNKKDFLKRLQEFEKELTEGYDVPQHFSLDILEIEIGKQKNKIKKLEHEMEMTFLFTQERFMYIDMFMKRIRTHEKLIKECQDAIGWIINAIR